MAGYGRTLKQEAGRGSDGPAGEGFPRRFCRRPCRHFRRHLPRLAATSVPPVDGLAGRATSRRSGVGRREQTC